MGTQLEETIRGLLTEYEEVTRSLIFRVSMATSPEIDAALLRMTDVESSERHSARSGRPMTFYRLT
jgi:predicted transcriptional regulator